MIGQVESIEFRDLRWAVAASQYRSLRQAAIALNVRQSTLSRRLRDVELEFGVILFERTNGGTHPTVVGSEFLEAARHIVQEAEALGIRFKARSRGESGTLRIGIHASLSAGNLRATIVEHRNRFPHVETYFVDGSSESLILNLTNQTLDIAFVADGHPRWEERSLPVWTERVIVAVPSDHPPSRRNIVYWTDFRDERLLLPQSGPGPEFLALLASKLGSFEACRIARHDVSLDRLLTLVNSSWGVLLMLEGATGASYPGVSFHEVHEMESPTRLGFSALWRQDNSNPSLGPLLELLRERYPDFATGTVL